MKRTFGTASAGGDGGAEVVLPLRVPRPPEEDHFQVANAGLRKSGRRALPAAVVRVVLHYLRHLRVDLNPRLFFDVRGVPTDVADATPMQNFINLRLAHSYPDNGAVVPRGEYGHCATPAQYIVILGGRARERPNVWLRSAEFIDTRIHGSIAYFRDALPFPLIDPQIMPLTDCVYVVSGGSTETLRRHGATYLLELHPDGRHAHRLIGGDSCGDRISALHPMERTAEGVLVYHVHIDEGAHIADHHRLLVRYDGSVHESHEHRYVDRGDRDPTSPQTREYPTRFAAQVWHDEFYSKWK